jgi:isoleucyl-tRNA synthetase
MTKLKIDNFQEKLNVPESEHAVLSFWDETHAFEKSVEIRSPKKRYVFYDGPPFATGLPHYGHILASTIKDVIPRYWTMKGYRVERVWGWDCHGIPIENIIEKELDLKGGKKGIEALGIDKFNASCRAAILRFDTEWEKVIRRIGRWVDFKKSYKTMDKTYMESVWWAFKELNDKGLVYEGRRVILYCPRCATPLSNFEIAMDNSYKDVEDNSVYVKFSLTKESTDTLIKSISLKGPNKGKINLNARVFFLAWTTTPWTLIGNVALAVLDEEKYEAIYSSNADEIYIVAKNIVDKGRLNFASKGQDAYTVIICNGSDLVGLEYEPLYPYMPLEGKKAHYVAKAKFVSLEEGTGIVHTAAIFGEDDYALAQELNLPCVPTLDDQGKFFDFVEPLKGVFYKKAEAWVIDDLTKRGLIYRSEKITHSYPFCYRCETPLYYNAVPAWFINVQKIKPDLVGQNENINWYPDHLKHGRFGKGLEQAPDWNISRSRYWGTPMPVWRSQTVTRGRGQGESEKQQMRIIGSLEELQMWAVEPEKVAKLTDIHREFIDDIEVWVDDKKTIKGKRIPEVFDCWVESGSMPYASIHYPFENKELFEESHPAQFIAEYIAQTRAWFYTLHVMSVGLFGKHTFENAVTTGTILAEDGTKMSKSKKNYPDPSVLFEKYGVDALRFYLMSSVVMKAENLNFSEKEVAEIYQKVIQILWNTFAFYKLYAQVEAIPDTVVPKHVLDRWLVSLTQSLVKNASLAMDRYDTILTCRLIEDYISALSTWYLRRSRERLKTDQISRETFAWALKNLLQVVAPITPFVAELVYQNLESKGESIHLTSWPSFNEEQIDTTLENDMFFARGIVEKIHAQRKEKAVPIRQPLAGARVAISRKELSHEIVEVIKEEVNIKSVGFTKSEKDIEVVLDTQLTDQLIAEGKMRELIRKIQALRKEKGLSVEAKINMVFPKEYKDMPKELIDDVKRKTLVESVVWGETISISIG